MTRKNSNTQLRYKITWKFKTNKSRKRELAG